MTVSEDQRFRMHQELRKVLGDEVGNTVMEHLPPLGWGDVARTKDITYLADRMTQIDQRQTMRTDSLDERLTTRINSLEERLTMRIDSLDERLTMRIDSLDERLTMRIDSLESQMTMRFDYVEKKMKSIATSMQVMIGAMVTVSTGIIVMLIQINMNISSL